LSFRRSGSNPTKSILFNALVWFEGDALSGVAAGALTSWGTIGSGHPLLRLTFCLEAVVAFARRGASTFEWLGSEAAGVATGGVSAGGLLWTSPTGCT